MNPMKLKKIHEVLNKKQIKGISKHQDYRTYVHSYDHPTVYARKGHLDDEKSEHRHVVIANSGTKHTLTAFITKHGKVLSTNVHRKHVNDSGHTEWHHVKSTSVKE